MKKILIIQPYIPGYRQEFFSMFAKALLEKDLELTVFAPQPDKNLSLRKDAATTLSFIHEVKVFRLKFFRRRLDLYRLPRSVKLSDFDLVIMEQSLKNIQFAIFVLLYSNKTHFALWGHGRTIVKKKSKIERGVQLLISKRADFFFAYTESGLRYLVDRGFPPENIIALGNSNSSRARLQRIKDLEDLKAKAAIDSSTDCCFIGALEDSKGIQLLVEALPIIKDAIPTFTISFFGDGPLRDVITRLASSVSYVSWLGYTEQEDFDARAVAYSLILNPGRVGLVAVDSLMLKLPIVTIGDSFHAPEFDYIRNNGCSLSVEGEASTYAQEVISLLNSPLRLSLMKQACEMERDKFTLESMVDNFISGVLMAVNQNEKKR